MYMRQDLHSRFGSPGLVGAGGRCGSALAEWWCHGDRLVDRPLQVGDVVGGDADQLPAVVAGIVEHVDVVVGGAHIVERDLSIFPSRHRRSFGGRVAHWIGAWLKNATAPEQFPASEIA